MPEPDDDIAAAGAALAVRLPEDYVAFMREHVGLIQYFETEYLDLWALAVGGAGAMVAMLEQQADRRRLLAVSGRGL